MYTQELATENRHYKATRRHPRFMISVPTRVGRSTMPNSPSVHGLSLDLSRGGASAVLCGPPAVGETVHLSLQFPGAWLETLAIVRHSNSKHSGFEFVDLSPARREQLESNIRALQLRPRRPASARPSPLP
jgi:c-di-GMP-binding flagellar brake protein YcgR